MYDTHVTKASPGVGIQRAWLQELRVECSGKECPVNCPSLSREF